MANRPTVWDRLRRYPPVACRLLARTGGRHPRPLSTKEIAQASGMPEHVVLSISTLTTWDGVDVRTMRAFARACGMDPTNSAQMRRADQYVFGKHLLTKKGYLKRAKDWRTYYEPLMQLWLSSLKDRPN